MDPHQRNSLSPAGQVDALGDLALGWRTNRYGRKRAIKMLAGLALVIVIAVIVAWIIA